MMKKNCRAGCGARGGRRTVIFFYILRRARRETVLFGAKSGTSRGKKCRFSRREAAVYLLRMAKRLIIRQLQKSPKIFGKIFTNSESEAAQRAALNDGRELSVNPCGSPKKASGRRAVGKQAHRTPCFGRGWRRIVGTGRNSCAKGQEFGRFFVLLQTNLGARASSPATDSGRGARAPMQTTLK